MEGTEEIEAVATKESPRENHSRRIKKYMEFLKEYVIPGPILPIRAGFVKMWFTFMSKMTTNEHGSYTQNLAALPRYSKDSGFENMSISRQI